MTSSINHIRVATFNIGLDQARERGQLAKLLATGSFTPALKSAEIIQRVRPDVILINEIDGNDNGKTLELYLEHYLEKSQASQPPVVYPYRFQPTCNTGLSSGINFRNNSATIDNYGFGHYNGQYCMAILSSYPIQHQKIQSFQKLLWKSLPDALLPEINGIPWYSPGALDKIRLSSKNHIDVPIAVNGHIIHLLASHPTPPVFDGEEDRNGRRNHDEIMFWQHYINGDTDWLLNDNIEQVKGLTNTSRFIVLGDLNASTVEGDATLYNKQRAITRLLHNERVAEGFSELRGTQNIPQRTGFNKSIESSSSIYAQYHTAQWQMRADYVLPSKYGFTTHSGGVFWPAAESELAPLVSSEGNDVSSSDHRLVWLDLEITSNKATK